jgi:hypothetical protein
MTITVMTENKRETNQLEQQQEQVEKWYLEPHFAVKNRNGGGNENGGGKGNGGGGGKHVRP